MTTATAYTPLECLLLFQSLAVYGTEDEDFLRISDLLTNSALVKHGETYDAKRLTVESLRDIFLQLMRDELKPEAETPDEGGQSSRKRKLPSPPLPTPKDVQEQRDKLPLLVDRLYARYRDYMIRAIREDEQVYARVQKEIAEIERGEWDQRLLLEEQAKAKKNGVVDTGRAKANGVHPSSPPQAKHTPPATVPEPVLPPARPSPTQSPRGEPRAEGLAISDVLNSRDTPVRSPTIPQEPIRNGNLAQAPPRSISNGPHGPSPLQPPGLQQPASWKWEPPYAHHPQHPQHPQQQLQNPPQHPSPMQQSPQPGQQSPHPQHPQHPPLHLPHPPYPQGPSFPPYNGPPPYPNQPYPPRGSFSGPHVLQPPHPHLPSSPLNSQHPQHPHQPILLPPPNAIRQSPTSPGMPLDALADAAGQQYRAPSGSPMLQQSPLLPGNFGPYSPQQRPPSSNGPQWNPQYAPPYPAHQVPPQQFQFPPNQPRPPFQPPPNLIQPENRQYNSPYNASQGPRPFPPQVQTPRPRPNAPNTPINPAYRPIVTGSGTRWTALPTASTPRANVRVESPQVEPLSPVRRPSNLPEPPKKTPKKPAPPKKIITGKPRERRAARPRTESAASSIVHGSLPTSSNASPIDELSMDMEPIRHVKEEVATPTPLLEHKEVPPDELPQHPTPSHPRPSFRQSTKRKRTPSVALEPRPSSTPPTQVLWTRAFPKISASALESIAGHKNASMFAAPIKEREAPGYTSLILQPQDLKSIRSAITAGHRAATAAAPADMNASSSSAWLPISEDLVPPRGIINYAQLEKELMRMFANAIMFNPDPERAPGRRWKGKGTEDEVIGYEIDEDGLVKDTKRMFADVEKIVGSLRSAERRSEEMMLRESSVLRGSVADDEDELAGDGEPVTGNTSKRRRKA